MSKFLFVVPFLLSLILVSSCTSLKSSPQARTLEDYYVATGVQKYFLTEIPAWANFDQKAGCYRSSNIQYFDIDGLMKNYGFTYNLALQVQSIFNDELIQFKKNQVDHHLTIKEQELLFFKANEKVNNKIMFFEAPTYARINLVWLDEILGDANKESKFKKLLTSNVMDEGVPVLVSFCLSKNELESRYPEFAGKMITAELFSIYTSNGSKTPGFKIDLNQFFKPNQKLNFYSQDKKLPKEELGGTYKIINY